LLNGGLSSNLTMPVGKVTAMLQEIQERSTQLQQQENLDYSKVQEACESTESTKTDELAALDLDIQTLEANVMQLKVDINTLITEISESNRDLLILGTQLEDSRKERVTQANAYARDLNEYNLALASIDRAIKVVNSQALGLIQNSDAAGDAIRDAQAVMAAAVADARRDIRQIALYQPDDGGIAKDEHMFDEFSSLSPSSIYEAQHGATVLDLLTNLETKFKQKKDDLISSEAGARESFTSLQTNLEAQLKSNREGITSKKGTRAGKEVELMTKESELSQASKNREATAAYKAKVEQMCAQRAEEYQKMSELRAQEIEAIGKAIELITATVAPATSRLWMFLQEHSSSTPGRARDRVAVADAKALHPDDAKNVIGFLRMQAGRLHSKSLRQLVGRVTTLAREGHADSATSHASTAGEAAFGAPSDRLEKVKQMIQDLITKLQQESVEEQTHKTWCETELGKSEAALTSAQSSIQKYSARKEKLASDIAQLVQDVTLLNHTLHDSTSARAEIVEQRTNDTRDNALTIQDAELSAKAIQAAIIVLTEYYKNATSAMALVAGRTRVTSRLQRGAHHADSRVVAVSHGSIDNLTSNEVLPADLTKEAVDGPLVGGVQSVIEMLEVVAAGFQKLADQTKQDEAKDAAMYTETLRELDVNLATATNERAYKLVSKSEYEADFNSTQSDLLAAEQALTDAQTNHEDLKAPCLSSQTYEQRKAQLQGEIAALKEAESMLENYAEEYGGVVAGLLQTHRRGAVLGDIDRVLELLKEIRTEVAADLADDQQIYDNMMTWCTATKGDTQQVLNEQLERDRQLVNLIELSMGKKETLNIEIQTLEQDLAQERSSHSQLSTLRDNELESFRNNEKELLEAIFSLRNAIIVLERVYNGTTQTDNFPEERERLESLKGSLNLSLAAKELKFEISSASSDVANALKSMPASVMNLAIASSQQNTVLQSFLARPLEFLKIAKRATLTQIKSAVAANPDGHTVLGILRQLLETFEADLQASRGKDTQDNTTYFEQKATKEGQIEALQGSLTSKQDQLAHATTEHAQATEDLAYVRGSRSADMKYLMDVEQQCLKTEQDHVVRSASRNNEIAALDQGIAILQADAGAAPSGQFLLARLQANAVPGSRLSADVKPVRSLIPDVTLATQDGAHILRHHRPYVERRVLKVPPRKQNTNVHGSSLMATGRVTLRLPTSNRSQQVDRGARAALMTQMQRARQLAVTDSLTKDEIEGIAKHIDSLVSDLSTKKRLEVKFRDTCISEVSQANRQRERRIGDSQRHNTSMVQLEMSITNAAEQISATDAEIRELNITLNQSSQLRNIELDELHKQVEEEEARLQTFNMAIETLRNFYEHSNATLLQVQPQEPELAAARILPKSGSGGGVHLLSASKPKVGRVPMMHFQSPRPGTAPIQRALGKDMIQGTPVVSPSTKSLLAHSHIHSAQNATSLPNVNRTQNATSLPKVNRTAMPAGFKKPLKAHAGAVGIINILQILIESAESTIVWLQQEEVRIQRDYTATTEQRRRSIEAKKREVVALQKGKGDAEVAHLEAQTAKEEADTEIGEINEWLSIVTGKCGNLEANFAQNQNIRQEEIDNLIEAKHQLLGAVGAHAADVLLELSAALGRSAGNTTSVGSVMRPTSIAATSFLRGSR